MEFFASESSRRICTSGELRRGGLKVKLSGHPFEVLVTLLEKPGQVVTREELHQKLWAQDTFVDFEHGLNKAINKVRDALGDDADNPRFIETLPRRGYRFLPPLTAPAEPEAPAAQPAIPPQPLTGPEAPVSRTASHAAGAASGSPQSPQLRSFWSSSSWQLIPFHLSHRGSCGIPNSPMMACRKDAWPRMVQEFTLMNNHHGGSSRKSLCRAGL